MTLHAGIVTTRLSRLGAVPALHRYWAVVPLLALGALDLSNLARGHSEAEDAPLYILNATTGESTFHPNHLLFGLVNRWNFLLWRAFGYDGNAAVPMQVLSVAASLLSVWLTYRIAIRAGVRPPIAVAAAGWLAFSFGFWVYSVEADTYLLPIPFLLLAVLAMLEPGEWSAARLAGIGLLLAAATLLHQEYVLAIPAFVVTLALLWRHEPGRNVGLLLRRTGVFTTIAVGAVAATYLVVGFLALGLHSAPEVVGWARGHASNGLWESPSAKTPVMLVVGFVRSILSINFLFRSDQTNSLTEKAFGGKSLVEERFLAEHGISTPAFFAICLAVATALAAGVWLLRQSVRHRAAKESGPDHPRAREILVLFAVAFTVITVAAIAVWEPGNPEFWIALGPAFVLLLAIRLPPRRRIVAVSAVLVVALFFVNFLGGVHPYSNASNDYWSVQNSGFGAVAHRGDVVVTDCPYICMGTLALITDTAPINAASDDVDLLAKALDRSASGRVLVSSWALDGPSGTSTASSAVRKRLWEERSRMVEIGRSGEQVIYVLPR